ncbi:MAG: hypothetical protein ACYCVN_12340 [Acidimicrobiales bacterium]
MPTAGQVAGMAVDPFIAAPADLAKAAGVNIGSVASSVIGKSATSAISGAVSSAVKPLVSGFARAGLYIVFVIAGLALVIIALQRLTKGPQEMAAKAASIAAVA